ncbi:sigma 54-interacting transcriptional regulator [uncultured Paludibaculum sp.]|uniref:sigma 54-interacting transcriptional regulator n=1 Tax=uncultured Paludibaculum sp. TaxID=1765020 RepID=UPI002AAAEC15|nr:sigma 54-interacting transcriptional regulator [uncultured Paludibaculum sp.]
MSAPQAGHRTVAELAQVNDETLREVFARMGLISTCGSHMTPLLRQAWKAARISDVPLLVEGETGTGKQVLASAIHELDEKRRRSPFVTVPCGAIPESLAESELFGHARGAYSGAHSARSGLFLSARGGTVFLDDVNDLSPSMQAKLLDVLQRGRVRPIGSDEEIPVDVRVIAAANTALEPMVVEKRFRPDLYYRLNVIHLRIPPLRERTQDLAAMILEFACRHKALYGPISGVDPDLLRHLENYPFTGNIRELEHAVQRMLFAKTAGDRLTLPDWQTQGPIQQNQKDTKALQEVVTQTWLRIQQGLVSLDDALGSFERALLEEALRSNGMTRKALACKLGISERSLYQKLHEFDLAMGPERTEDSGQHDTGGRRLNAAKGLSQIA